MRRWTLVLALTAPSLLLSAPSSADLLAPGFKSVRTSIRVEGSLPEGKSLVLNRTFKGADEVLANQVVPVEWHPANGPMQLVLIDASAVTNIKKAVAVRAEAKVFDEIVQKGTKCGSEIMGVRTLPDTSPASEVRWVYSIHVEGALCNATLLRTEYLTKAGEVVQSDTGSGSGSGGAPPVPATAPNAAASTNAPAPAASSAAPAPAPGAVPGGCGACGIGEGAPDPTAGWPLLAALGLLFARRRKR